MKYHSYTSKSYKGLDKHLSTNHNIKSKDYCCQYIRPPNIRVYIRGKPTQFLNLRKIY